MKKLAIVACLYAGCVCGMQCPEETDVVHSKITMSDVQNVESSDRSIRIDVNNPNLIDQWQSIADTTPDIEPEDNIFETSASAYKEGRFWTVVRKVFQPVQITTSASTMVLITASEMVRDSHPSASTVLSYGALGSAVTSGVLSLFISKMTSKINTLNKIYKAKLAAEKIVVNTEGI
jgi:hypothetical protein